jgi:hypothetical protein
MRALDASAQYPVLVLPPAPVVPAPPAPEQDGCGDG